MESVLTLHAWKSAGTRGPSAATSQLHTANTAPQLGRQQPQPTKSPFQDAAMSRAGSSGMSRASSGASEQDRRQGSGALQAQGRQGSGALQSQGSVPNHHAEEEDDVFLTPELPLKPLKKCASYSALPQPHRNLH